MPPQTIESRVEKLEDQVMNLQQLPARIDALSVQMSQLREDLTAKISATKNELRTEIREEIVASEARVLVQVRVLHEDVISRLVLIQEGQPRAKRRRT